MNANPRNLARWKHLKGAVIVLLLLTAFCCCLYWANNQPSPEAWMSTVSSLAALLASRN